MTGASSGGLKLQCITIVTLSSYMHCILVNTRLKIITGFIVIMIIVHITRFSDVITLSRPLSSSSLKVNNRVFRHASPRLWNQLRKDLRLPTDHEDLSLSSDLTHVSSFPASPLSPSITLSHFHSRLKTHLFHKTFPPFLLPSHPPDWLHGL